MNGYPAPEIGTAHILRTTTDRGRKNEKIHVIHWRDGWTVCEDNGPLLTDPEKWIEDRLFEDYDAVFSGDYFDTYEYRDNEGPAWCENLIEQEIENGYDLIGIDTEGRTVEGYHSKSAQYSNDTHHYALAYIR